MHTAARGEGPATGALPLGLCFQQGNKILKNKVKYIASLQMEEQLCSL